MSSSFPSTKRWILLRGLQNLPKRPGRVRSLVWLWEESHPKLLSHKNVHFYLSISRNISEVEPSVRKVLWRTVDVESSGILLQLDRSAYTTTAESDTAVWTGLQSVVVLPSHWTNIVRPAVMIYKKKFLSRMWHNAVTSSWEWELLIQSTGKWKVGGNLIVLNI